MLQLDLKLCGECGGCVAVCPHGALELYPDGLLIKHGQCALCENCAIFCPVEALSIKPVHSQPYCRSKNINPKNG
jgi:ferredoxin